MPEPRRVFRLHRSLVVAIPPHMREHLGVDRGQPLYWHKVRGAEAVLSMKPERKGGRPEGLQLEHELAVARREIARLRQRNEARDRTMYAEGYNVGYLQCQERLTAPGGRSSERQRRRRIYFYTFPEAGKKARKKAEPTVVPGPDSYVGPEESAAAAV
jgi:hypothetical protein